MAKTTKRVEFQRTITLRYFADMPAFGGETDAAALAAANLPGGINSIGNLLAQSAAAGGTYTEGNWSVSTAGVAIEPYGIFVPSYAYAVGDRINPPGSAFLYICRVAGISAAAEPTWGTTVGGSTTSGTAQFACVSKFYPTPNFAVSTAYTVGQIVRSGAGNSREFLVTVAGTSAASAPTWPSTVGATVVSGGVTFLCISL